MILSSNYYFLIFVILVHFWTFVHVLFTQQWISNVFNLQSVGKHLTTFLVLHVSNHKKKVCVGFSSWKDLHTEQFTVMPRGYRFSGVGDNSILGSLWTGVCVCEQVNWHMSWCPLQHMLWRPAWASALHQSPDTIKYLTHLFIWAPAFFSLLASKQQHLL